MSLNCSFITFSMFTFTPTKLLIVKCNKSTITRQIIIFIHLDMFHSSNGDIFKRCNIFEKKIEKVVNKNPEISNIMKSSEITTLENVSVCEMKHVEMNKNIILPCTSIFITFRYY